MACAALTARHRAGPEVVNTRQRSASCRIDESGIAALDMAAELQPSTHQGMQREQHRIARRVHHEGTAGEVAHPIAARHRVRMGGKESEVVVTELVLVRGRRLPGGEDLYRVDV